MALTATSGFPRMVPPLADRFTDRREVFFVLRGGPEIENDYRRTEMCCLEILPSAAAASDGRWVSISFPFRRCDEVRHSFAHSAKLAARDTRRLRERVS